MKIILPTDLENLVQQKIASGTFNSPSEVIQESLRLLKRQDELKKIELEELRQEILKGYEQSQRGESEPFDLESIKTEGRKRLSKKREIA